MDEQRDKILKMLEEKERQRQEKIREIKNSNRPDWEKKMMLKAARSSTYGWGMNDARRRTKAKSILGLSTKSNIWRF